MGFRRNKGDDDKKPSESDKAKADDKKAGEPRRAPFGGRGGEDKPPDDSATGRRGPFARGGTDEKKPEESAGGRRNPFARGGDDKEKETDDKGGGRSLFGRNRDSAPPPAAPTDSGSRSPFSRTSSAPPASNEPGGRTFGAGGRSPSSGPSDEPGGRVFGSSGRSATDASEAGGRTFGTGGASGTGGRSPRDSESDTSGTGGRPSTFSSSRPASGGAGAPFGGSTRGGDADKRDEGEGSRAPFGRSPSASTGGAQQPASMSRTPATGGGSAPFGGSGRSLDADRRDEDESGRGPFGRSPSAPSGGAGGSQPSSRTPSAGGGSTPFGGPSRTPDADKRDESEGGRSTFGRTPASPSGGSQPSSRTPSAGGGSTPFGGPSSGGGGSSAGGGRPPSTPSGGSSSTFGRSTPSTPSAGAGGASTNFGGRNPATGGATSGRPTSAPPTGRTPIGADAAKKDDKGKKDDKKGRDKQPKEEKERKPLFSFRRGGDKADTKKDDKKKDDKAAAASSAFAGRRSEPAKGVKAPQKAAPLPKVENLPRNVTSPITLDRKLDLAGVGLIAVAAILAFGWMQTQFATTEARGFMAQVDGYAAQIFGMGRFVWIVVCGYVGGWLLLRHFGRMFDIDYFRLMGYALTYLAFVATLQWLDLFFMGDFISGFPEVQYFPDKEALKVASDALWQEGSGGGVAGHLLYTFFHRQLGDWVFEAFLFFWWGLGIFFAFDLSFEKIATGMIARRHAKQAQRAVERVEVPATAPALAITAATVAAEAVNNKKKKGAEISGKRTEAPANAPITADTDGDAPQRQERGIIGRRSAEPVASTNAAPQRRGILGRGGRQQAPVEVAATGAATAALLVATEAPTQEQDTPQRRGIFGRGGRTAAPETPATQAPPSRDLGGRTGRRLDEPTQAGITATGEQPAVNIAGQEAPGGRRPITLKADTTAPETPATEGDEAKRQSLIGRTGRQQAPDAEPIGTPMTPAAATTDSEQGKRQGLFGRSGRQATPDAEPTGTPITPTAATDSEQGKRQGLFGRSGRQAAPDAEPTGTPITPTAATTDSEQGKRQGLFGRSGRQPSAVAPEAPKTEAGDKPADAPTSQGGMFGSGGRSAASDIVAGAALAATALTDKANEEPSGGSGRRSLFGRGGTSTPATPSGDMPAGRRPIDTQTDDNTTSLPRRQPADTPSSMATPERRQSPDLPGRRAMPTASDDSKPEPTAPDGKLDKDDVLPRRTQFDIPTSSAAKADSPPPPTEAKAEEQSANEGSPAQRPAFELGNRKPSIPEAGIAAAALLATETLSASEDQPSPEAPPARRTPFDFTGRPAADRPARETTLPSSEAKAGNGQTLDEAAPAKRPMFDFAERKPVTADLTPSPDEAQPDTAQQQPARRTPFDFAGRRPAAPVSEDSKDNGEKAASPDTAPARPVTRPVGEGDNEDGGEDDLTAAAARRATSERRSVFGGPTTPPTNTPAAPSGLYARRPETQGDPSAIFKRREPTSPLDPPTDLPGRAPTEGTFESKPAPAMADSATPVEPPPVLEPAKPRGVNFAVSPTEALGRRLPSKDAEPSATDDINATQEVDDDKDSPPPIQATTAPEPVAVLPQAAITPPLESSPKVAPPPASKPVTAEHKPADAKPSVAPPKVPDTAKAAPSEPAPTGPARWQPPNFRELLQEGSNQDIDQAHLLEQARIIEDTLDSFGAPGRVVEVNTGPVITQFGIEPNYIEKRGGSRSRVKVAAIASLDKDLALALAAKSIRIEAPVPGKGYVGIEVPNSEAALVSLRDVMDSPQHDKLVTKSKLTISLGKRVDGGAVSADLTQMPHLLIAGATGSGKSICVNAVIACLLLQNTPAELQFIMVDPKRVELAGYNGIPHLVAPVVVDLERIVGVLKWVQREMDDRYKRFAGAGARHILDYNGKLPAGQEKMPYLVVIIDELADLMMLAPDETERLIARLAQMARATGIHLIISTQRPSVDVVTGLIKANFPARIAFAVASSVDSRVILDQPGAEKLLGRGDMLYQAPDSPAPLRMQGVYVSDPELNRVTHYWKSTAALSRGGARPPVTKLSVPETPPLPTIISRSERILGESSGLTGNKPPTRQPDFWQQVKEAENDDDEEVLSGEDDLYDEAVELVQQRRKASISMLQRHFRIGYTRAARLIDIMEEHGVVGPAESGAKPREVLIDSDGKEIDYSADDDDDE